MATIADVRQRPHERKDRWWIEPVTIVSILGAFIVYSLIVSVMNANYFYEPYLSPFYSPCLTTGCIHPTWPIFGDWYTLSPAFLIVGSPLAFRVTCYYYRRSYYRAFFWAPPACTIPDARAKYSGETRFPFILQNIHRYALYLAIVVLAILWWDANVLLLSGYTLGCHAARYLVGGYLDSFHGKSFRFRLWELATKLNERHSRWAWFSLFGVALTDLYIRLNAAGVIIDPRLVF